ncbi:MAG: hypothetical protein MJZ26_03115 [Fibrobacter sp.]|nr:hypothetical protein [Fibrobacter sp.]
MIVKQEISYPGCFPEPFFAPKIEIAKKDEWQPAPEKPQKKRILAIQTYSFTPKTTMELVMEGLSIKKEVHK